MVFLNKKTYTHKIGQLLLISEHGGQARLVGKKEPPWGLAGAIKGLLVQQSISARHLIKLFPLAGLATLAYINLLLPLPMTIIIIMRKYEWYAWCASNQIALMENWLPWFSMFFKSGQHKQSCP